MTESKKRAPQWVKGQSGNPKGRPRGARDHVTRAVLALLESGVEDVARAVLEAAKAGDLVACRLVLERIVCPVKERPVSLILPDTIDAQGCADAAAAVLHAVADGTLLPGEGATLAGIVESRRRTIETLELEQRIVILEESQNGSR